MNENLSADTDLLIRKNQIFAPVLLENENLVSYNECFYILAETSTNLVHLSVDRG